MLKQGIINIGLALALGLCLGAIFAQTHNDRILWEASNFADEQARLKAAAYVTTFEGLKVYAYECGTVVVE